MMSTHLSLTTDVEDPISRESSPNLLFYASQMATVRTSIHKNGFLGRSNLRKFTLHLFQKIRLGPNSHESQLQGTPLNPTTFMQHTDYDPALRIRIRRRLWVAFQPPTELKQELPDKRARHFSL